jgi:hypothetical protein
MNGRERMFFRDVPLYKSASYVKREDEENVKRMRDTYFTRRAKRAIHREAQLKKANSWSAQFWRWLYSEY